MTGFGMAGPEGGVWSVKTWPDRPGVVEVNGQRLPVPAPGARPQQLQQLNPTTLRAQQFTIGAPTVPAPAAPSPETTKAIDDLRRQVNELRVLVQKLSERQ